VGRRCRERGRWATPPGRPGWYGRRVGASARPVARCLEREGPESAPDVGRGGSAAGCAQPPSRPSASAAEGGGRGGKRGPGGEPVGAVGPGESTEALASGWSAHAVRDRRRARPPGGVRRSAGPARGARGPAGAARGARGPVGTRSGVRSPGGTGRGVRGPVVAGRGVGGPVRTLRGVRPPGWAGHHGRAREGLSRGWSVRSAAPGRSVERSGEGGRSHRRTPFRPRACGGVGSAGRSRSGRHTASDEAVVRPGLPNPAAPPAPWIGRSSAPTVAPANNTPQPAS
jgi:hypothetical protein